MGKSVLRFVVANIVFLPLTAFLMVAGGLILYAIAWLFGPFGEMLGHWLGGMG